MNKEMKETLDKVAVYEEWVKQKALKAGNLAFASMFVISVLAIIIQMLLTVDIRLVLGRDSNCFGRRNPVRLYYGVQWNMG